MVYLIDGEILEDNHPRAIALRGGATDKPVDAVQLCLKAKPEARAPPESPLEAIAQFIGIDGKTLPVPACKRLGLHAHDMPVIQLLFSIVLLFIFPSVLTPVIIVAMYVRHVQTLQSIESMPTAYDATENLRSPCGGHILGHL